RRADCCNPAMTQEEEQDDDGEHRADDHRVAHRLHRIAYERRLIVYGFQVNTRWQLRLKVCGDRRNAVGDLESVPADLTGDVEECGGTPVTRDDANVIF